MATRGLIRFARALPRQAGLKVFSAIGSAAGRVMRKDRDTALSNLEIAFPDMAPPLRSAMVKAMYRTLGQNAFEFLNLKGRTPQQVTGLIETVEGREHVESALAKGKGFIAVTGHIGCFELLAAYWANSGYSVNVVARELWEKRINDDLVSIRDGLGYRSIDRDSGGREVIRILRANGVVAVLMDQHTRVSGTYVPFFNRPAHTPTGVAKLAIRTGAPIVPMAIYMTKPGKHIIRILPEILADSVTGDDQQRVDALTERSTQAIEQLIRFDPKQWVWFHKRWREPEADLAYAATG